MFLTFTNKLTVVIIIPHSNKLVDFRNERKQSASAIFANKSTTACKKPSNFDASKLLKNTCVDFIFVDASDKHDKMPLDTVDIDLMKMKGTYFTNQTFTNEDDFVNFIESNAVHGTALSKNFYLYTIARQYTGRLKPTIFHKRNFPNDNSMVAICQTRFLVISPHPKDIEEKKKYFSTTRVNGVTNIDIDEEVSSEDESYDNEITATFLERNVAKYESDDEEAFKHSTPRTDVESCSAKKRSFPEDNESGDEAVHFEKEYHTSSYAADHFPTGRDSGERDLGSSSSSKARKIADKRK